MRDVNATMPIPDESVAQQDRFIVDALERNEPRLRRFIRSRGLDLGDVEDVLQDVFFELISAYRLLKPAEQVTAWLFQVARNRITDLFRRRKALSLEQSAGEDESTTLGDLLPSPDAGPDALYARNLLFEEVEQALDDLPPNQREVFIAHEFEGRSFKDIAAETGTSVNTLLSRKRYAVLHLRQRLQQIQQEYGNKENQ
jgi:RNA polymerase sigma factor (sigma-70 family)